MALLSPGVEVRETSRGQSIQTAASSYGAYVGIFNKGEAEKAIPVASTAILKTNFGNSSLANVNDWQQCAQFLKYADTLYVTRVIDRDGSNNTENASVLISQALEGDTTLNVADTSLYFKNAFVKINETVYQISDITEDTITSTFTASVDFGTLSPIGNDTLVVTIDGNIYTSTFTTSWSEFVGTGFEGTLIFNETTSILTIESNLTFVIDSATGGLFPVISQATETVEEIEGSLILEDALIEDVDSGTDILLATPSYNAFAELGTYTTEPTLSKMKSTLVTIANSEEFGYIQNSIQKASTETKLKFVAKTPGSYYNGIEIAIANPSDFGVGATAFGTNVDDFFEFFPSEVNREIAVLVKNKEDEISSYLVSLDPEAKDYRGKSTYIENVINPKNSDIYVLDNTVIKTCPSALDGNEIKLSMGENGKPGKGEIVEAYSNVFGNVEEIKVDIFIANEIANVEVLDLAGSLGECIAIIGARYEDVVGFKAAKAVENLVSYASGEFNVSNKYGAFYGNYIEVYDSTLDKDVWVNVAGAVAGLRAKTNSEAGHWGANFGLDVYGQLTGVKRIAFNTIQTQRDALYKLGVNPIVSFTGQGNAIIWGNKTTWKSPDPFSRVHVRSLFNYIETLFRASAKYVIGRPNDSISRGIFRAATAPVLDMIVAKRGINNYRIFYPEIIDDTVFEFQCYIQPTGVVETVVLSFIAVDNSITIDEVIGTV